MRLIRLWERTVASPVVRPGMSDHNVCSLVHETKRSHVMQVSIAMVITTEQVASYIAGEDLQLAYKAADEFLLRLVTEGEGPVIDRLQDSSWLVSGVFATAEQLEDAIPPDEASVSALADAIVLVNQQLVERRRDFDGDVESLIIDWSKTAHAADVVFAEGAVKLRAGDLTTETYRCGP